MARTPDAVRLARARDGTVTCTKGDDTVIWQIDYRERVILWVGDYAALWIKG